MTPLTEDWAEDFPVRIAAQLAVEPTERARAGQGAPPRPLQQAALIAGREAWADAGFTTVKHGGPGDTADPDRLAVVIGTGIGGALTLLGQDDILEASGVRRVSPHTVPMLMPNGPAAASASTWAPRPACTRRPAPAPPAPRRSRSGWT